MIVGYCNNPECPNYCNELYYVDYNDWQPCCEDVAFYEQHRARFAPQQNIEDKPYYTRVLDGEW